jgi:putative transposase
VSGIARSTYYYRKKTEPKRKERELEDHRLRDLIDSIHVKFPYFGYRKLIRELRRRGITVGVTRIRRIQAKYGLFAIKIRKFIRTTDSKHKLKVYPNLLRPPPELTGLDEVWTADITYVRILSGFVFVAVILDLCSRKVIGWAISKHIDEELVVAALRMAIEKRKPDPGCIHHSDRGVQYASRGYIELLEEWKFQISMSRKGNPYDNAWTESFMKILKYEEVYLVGYETYEDVVRRIPEFLEQTYNKERIHSAIGYLTPEEFEWEIKKKKVTTEPGAPLQI